MLFDPRDSLNPRAFAVRHALLETLKLRLRDAASDPERERLVRLARQIEVEFDSASHGYVVRGVGDARVMVPVTAFRFYEPRDPATADPANVRDEALEANRAQASIVVEQLLADNASTGDGVR